ncbi:Phospho-N-acetylmuramoyl-pentapeptide-transferase [Peptoniphilus sp. ING2-D1G]|nr:Phospho-N-acetylmuramoyl-pentapeptide-transferase [Peptoniphilus sp. ING2-D1G]
MDLKQKILYFIISIIISLVMGRILLPMLKKLNASQSIREDGPAGHRVKNGTPTIGGFIFLTTIVIVSILSRNFNLITWVLIFATLLFGAVGFVDDYIKVIKKRNLGLTARDKLIFQIAVALILVFYQYNSESLSSSVFVPILKIGIDLGVFYIPFIIFVVVGTVNSVNLTDGLDGLASLTSIITLGFFAVVANKMQRYEIEFFCIILAGALFGFLHFNKYPAKVFMGDTGSLALGGAIVGVAVLLNLSLILPIAGGIFFIETLSVIIQVISFKTTGKRVFLMSPLHHHFEQKGWKETKIVLVFSTIQLILCIIAFFMIF